MRAPLLLAALLLVAGCVTPTTSTGDATAAVCDPALCDLLATVDPPTRQANELSVAVNPLDPNNIIAAGKDYTPGEAGDCTWAGVYATKDGGKTWVNQNVPGSPWKRLEDPTAPETMFTRYWCATDPVVAFGPDGRAYWTVMPYQCDPATGSKTGRGVIPGSPVTGGGGGLNDWAWSCSAMAVLVSDDGGVTWPVEKARIIASGARLVHDKQWIAVAPDGKTVLLCWDYANPAEQTVGMTPPSGDDPLYATHPTSVVCSKSTDRGDTWSEMTFATDAGGIPWIEFDAQGRAWMALIAGWLEGEILVLHSEDGLTWSEPVTVGTFKNGPETNDHGWPTLRNSQFRLVQCPSIAIDRSGGPHDGRIYVTWFDHAAGHGETMLSWSDDGVTWTPAKRVNDDTGDADQFMPVVSVGPDGTVDMSWNDRRDDPGNYLYHTYYAYSVDGGETFSPNLRLTSVASDEQHSHHQNGMIFLGDYRDADSAHGRSTTVWVDTRDQKADVRVATVLRPGAAGR